jgi:hypothetical protein
MKGGRERMLVRFVFLSFWRYIDPVYYSLTRLQYLCSDQEKGIFRVRLTRYKGKNVTLSDGTEICKNDLLVKIHLHNIKVIKDCTPMKNDLSKGKAVFKMVLDSMPYLASYIYNHPKKEKIKGVIGITLINKGVKGLGFECVLPESKLYTQFKKISQMFIYLLSHSTISVENFKKHHPVYLMMSKEKLMEKYKN